MAGGLHPRTEQRLCWLSEVTTDANKCRKHKNYVFKKCTYLPELGYVAFPFCSNVICNHFSMHTTIWRGWKKWLHFCLNEWQMKSLRSVFWWTADSTLTSESSVFKGNNQVLERKETKSKVWSLQTHLERWFMATASGLHQPTECTRRKWMTTGRQEDSLFAVFGGEASQHKSMSNMLEQDGSSLIKWWNIEISQSCRVLFPALSL